VFYKRQELLGRRGRLDTRQILVEARVAFGYIFLRLFFICLRPWSCVPVASFSGLSILYCPFDFL
jgi:hypothetical protein